MYLLPLAHLELKYADLAVVEVDAGVQYYGHLEGSLTGRLSGRLRLTNFARGRPDDVNLPTLRGLLETEQGVTVWVEMDGIAVPRDSDGARVFLTRVTLRTDDDALSWLNQIFGLLEGTLDTDTMEATGQLHECRPFEAPASPEG